MSVDEVANSITPELTISDNHIEAKDSHSHALQTDLVKMNNRIKYSEFSVDESRKKCEDLSRECYNLLRTTEILAFDFIFSEYLFGHIDAQEVYQFIERCINPGFDFSKGSDDDFSKAVEFSKELQNRICQSANFLLKCDYSNINVSRRTSEFLVFLKDQKFRLDQKIGAKKTDQEIDKNPTPELELPISFAKWLCTELKVGSDPDEEAVEIRSLIGSVARRISALSHLRDSISEMRKVVLDPSDIEITDCSPSSVPESPFFTGLQKSCAYLISASKALQLQQTILPKCGNVLQSIKSHLNVLSDSCQVALGKIQEQIKILNERTTTRQTEAGKLRSDLQPYMADLYPTNIALSETGSRYEENARKIREELSKVPAGSETSVKLHAELQEISELQKVHQELVALTEEYNNNRSKAREKDRNLFVLLSENAKAIAETSLHNTEASLLAIYNESLDRVSKAVSIQDCDGWCVQLEEIAKGVTNCALRQREAADQFEKIAEIGNVEQQIATHQQEVADLSTKDFQRCMELGQAKQEMADALEEEFRLTQELDLFTKWVPPGLNKSETENYRFAVYCPICEQRRRNCILATCGHAMCKECVDSYGKKECPICQKLFTDSDVKPFFMQ